MYFDVNMFVIEFCFASSDSNVYRKEMHSVLLLYDLVNFEIQFYEH